MKKRLLLTLLCVALTLTAACGSSDTDSSDAEASDTTEDVTYAFSNSSVTSLGNYINVEIAARDLTVTDDEIQAEIDYLLASCQETVIVDKTAVEEGDTVDIDYIGYLDGEAFSGGSAEGYLLTIGSGTFIDGFEDGLIGAEPGTTVSLNLTFPESYGSSTLAGQDVVFDVTINSVVEYITPEWTDEFVAENTSYSTIEEYTEGTREELANEKNESYESYKSYYVMQAIADATEFDLNDDDVQTIADSLSYQYEYYASYFGIELEDFLYYYYGMTLDEFNEQIAEAATFQLQCTLITYAVSEAEGISVTDEEYEEGATELATDYGYDTLADFENDYGYSTIYESLLYTKIVEYVTEMAVEV